MNEGSDRIDYTENSDITEIHAAIKREHADPGVDVTPSPLWLTAICGVALVWAGAYIGTFHGGFSANVYDEFQSSPAKLFPQPEKANAKGAEAGATQTLAQQGKAVFGQCAACHGANGAGTAPQAPPLAGSEWAKGGEKRMLAIILKGATGPITVLGKSGSYTGNMVGWEATLTSKKIAAVASYVRSEWGNNAPEVTVEDVEEAKKEFKSRATQWTESELLQIPADANFGGSAPAPAPSSAGAPPAPAAGSGAPTAAGGDFEKGKGVYMTICIACHQANGAGVPSVFPPLTKSPYVGGSVERFAAIILKGNTGPFTVDGKPFGAAPMTPQEAVLTDDKIAAVMTFVRGSFGNTGGPVSADAVAAARKKFEARKESWTQPELDAWKE